MLTNRRDHGVPAPLQAQSRDQDLDRRGEEKREQDRGGAVHVHFPEVYQLGHADVGD